MRVAATLNPAATGLRTESGELVGAVTAEGTLFLLIFGGLLFGVIGGTAWIVIRPWLPGSDGARTVVAAFIALPIGGPLLVRADNPDFRILESDGAILAMLLGLVALVGLAIGWFDGRLRGRLPNPGERPWRLGLVYGVIALLGILALPIAVGFYLSPETCGCVDPPRLVGWALVAVGVATAASWLVAIATGRTDPPLPLQALGRLGLLAALGLGTVRVVGDLARILGTS